MTTWDGTDRRKGSGEDHDLLIKIDTNLLNLMTVFTAHVEDDKRQFASLDTRLKILEKVYWAGIGIIIVVELVAQFIK